MSYPSSRRNSQRDRRPLSHTASTSDYHYQDLALAGPTLPSSHSEQQQQQQQQQQQYQEFNSLDQPTTYLQSNYPSVASKSQPATISASPQQQELYSSPAGYYQRTNSSEETMMMSQREMNYGYMQGPIHGSMPNYPPPQPYAPQHLAPLPGYYADSQAQRNMSGSSRPNSQPLVDFQSFNSQERDSSLQNRKRRRTSQSGDRRAAKLQVRRNRLPGITNLSPVENDGMGGSVDMFQVAPPSQAYVPDSIDRSQSRTSMSPPYRNDYHDVAPGHQQYVSQPYHPGYTMGPVNPSSLAPPLLPGSNNGYNGGRSSPLLQAPLPPAPNTISPHVEPVVLDRREKPQCWDHGCNGREFSTFSNLLRHQREKSGSAAKSYCPHCGAEFTRTTARNGHMEHGKCKTRRTSNANTGANADASNTTSSSR